jgi:predicted dehydrogenase
MSNVKKVLVIGVGSIGQRHLRCFQATGRAQLSICEVNAALREQIARTQGIGRAYAALDEALAEGPDAAVVTTPAHLHVSMAIEAAEAGVHLLIEKPLGTSLEGLDRLASVVDQRRLAAAVAYVLRANPVFQAMREAITSGRFGPPVQVVVTSGQHFPTYRPAYRTIYYRDRATGGGAIQDALTHLVNLAEWIVGPADRVLADASHQVLEGVDVEDTVHLLSRHGPVMAAFALNQHQAPNETAITVVCRDGTARCEPFLNRWRWMNKPEEPWHDECAAPVERDTLFTRQAGSFLDAIEGRGAPLCSLAEGIQTLRVNLAALASCQSASWQTIERGCS